MQPIVPTKHSFFAKFAFFWSIGSLALYILGIVLMVLSFAEIAQSGKPAPQQLSSSIGGSMIAMVLGFLGALVGLILSIIAVCSHNTRKVLPIISLCLTGALMLLALVGIVIRN